MTSTTTPVKRPLEGPGDEERPSKRAEPGTPEEGEVDDDDDQGALGGGLGGDDTGGAPERHASPTPGASGSNINNGSNSRVKFPFKKVGQGSKEGGGGGGVSATNALASASSSGSGAGPGVIYDRPAEVDYALADPPGRYGRNDTRRRGGGGGRQMNMNSHRGGPHYRDGRPPGGGRYPPDYPPNDRHYAPYARDNRHEYDSRGGDRRHHRDSRRPPSPGRERLVLGSYEIGPRADTDHNNISESQSQSQGHSRSSRSPSGSPSSQKERHRLPPPRSPPSALSPGPASAYPSRSGDHWAPGPSQGHGDRYVPNYSHHNDYRQEPWEYDSHRGRGGDHYRGGGGGDYHEGRGDWDRDRRSRNFNFNNPREDFRLDRYHHDRGGPGPNSWRPPSPAHRPHSPGAYKPRSPGAVSSTGGRDRDRGGAYKLESPGSYRPISPGAGDSYRPVSPGAGPSTLPNSKSKSSLPPEPSAPRPHSPTSIAPRPSSPHEGGAPPSPIPMERRKDETLQLGRAAIAINVKNSLPPKHEKGAERGRVFEGKEKEKAGKEEKREVLRRTREQEKEAYGRIFLGCGQREDYELATKLGEGTFGEVHKAVQRSTGRTVALKRILMHNEKEGMPVTALREIKVLKAMHHPCVIDLLDMFVVRSTQESPMSVYMVFPYMDHDLAGLLENERVQLQPSHIKLFMKQLLEGTEYMHRNHILHRDMKAANLLISNDGSLKIADFGLARAYDPSIVHFPLDFQGKERKYTNCVVTRWYRPPELLLGARQYGGEVDLWGIGCVMAEMFMRRPVLPGSSDLDQLDKIFSLCGTPNSQTWPNFDALPGCEGVKQFNRYNRRVRAVYEEIGAETVDLIDKMLVCNPLERITASDALDHDYFWTDPLPAEQSSLKAMNWEPSHELDKRSRRQPPPGGPGGPLPRVPPGNGPPMPNHANALPPIHLNPQGQGPSRGPGGPGGGGFSPPSYPKRGGPPDMHMHGHGGRGGGPGFSGSHGGGGGFRHNGGPGPGWNHQQGRGGLGGPGFPPQQQSHGPGGPSWNGPPGQGLGPGGFPGGGPPGQHGRPHLPSRPPHNRNQNYGVPYGPPGH